MPLRFSEVIRSKAELQVGEIMQGFKVESKRKGMLCREVLIVESLFSLP